MQDQNSLSLTDSELSRLAAILNVLKDTSHYHCSTFADVDIVLLMKILQSWPTTMMFPGLFSIKFSLFSRKFNYYYFLQLYC